MPIPTPERLERTDDAELVGVVAVPVADDGGVARVAVTEDVVGDAGRVAVREVQRAVAPDPHGVLAVPVPVPGQRLITGIAVAEEEVGVAGTVLVAKKERTAAVHADGVDAVAVPVTDDRSVGRCAIG